MISETILQQALDADHERRQRIVRSWDAYYGKLPKPLKTKPGAVDDNVRMNYAGLIVDEGVSFLFGQSLEFEVAGKTKELGDESEEEAETKWLSDCWDANRRMTFLTKVGINGAVTGHTFLKMTLPPTQEYPRLIVLDPATVTALWDTDDFEDVLAYIIQWNAIDPQTLKAVTRQQIIQKQTMTWSILDRISRGDNRAWEIIGQQTWQYPWSPIFHCQNLPAPNEFWGRADLEDDVLEACKAINFTMSNISRILKFHAHPKTWGKGFNSKQIDMSVDNLIVLEGDEATLQNLEMQTDLGSSIEFYERLKEGLHSIAQVPEVATGKVDGIGALSGIALDLLFKPIVHKTGKKQLTYGDMLADLNKRLLEVGGKGEDLIVTPHWPNVTPVSDLEEAQTGQVYSQLGVSRDTILSKLGFDPELEAQKRKSEDQSDMQLEVQRQQLLQPEQPSGTAAK